MQVSLLEAMQGWSNDTYLADLRDLGKEGYARLRRVLEYLPPELGTLEEWNEALAYIADAKHEKTPAEARAALISYLAAETEEKER